MMASYMQCRRVLIKALAISLILVSEIVSAAWSHGSYKNILNTALKYQPKFEKKLSISSPYIIRGGDIRYDLTTLRKVYARKMRPMPAELVKVFDDPYFNTVTIPYYKNGFGKQRFGGLDKSVEYLMSLAKSEIDEDIKLTLTMFATYYYAESHYPCSTVSYFDHRSFSSGDNHGNEYCLSKNNLSMSRTQCRLSVNAYWSSLIERMPLEVDDANVALVPVKTVIEETANLAPYVYSVPPNSGLYPHYINLSTQLAKQQGEIAASRIVALWKWLYTL